MKTRWSSRVAGSVAAACLLLAGATAIAQAAVTTNEWTPVDGTSLGNPCTGETVALTGMGHALMTSSPAANGGYSFTVHVDFADVTGIGSAGNTYRIPTAIEASSDTNGASTATAAAQISLIGLGSAPNFEGHLVMHLTFNANGVPTASVASITPTGCRG